MRRVIEKDNFRQMRMIGQFNLRFILAQRHEDLSVGVGRRARGVVPSLLVAHCPSYLLACLRLRFIIDQHATDEKYGFETLQRTTVLNSQPLLNPLPLELSPAMEITIAEHIDIFKKNGFDIEIKETNQR